MSRGLKRLPVCSSMEDQPVASDGDKTGHRSTQFLAQSSVLETHVGLFDFDDLLVKKATMAHSPEY